jgi:hypothetical protein
MEILAGQHGRGSGAGVRLENAAAQRRLAGPHIAQPDGCAAFSGGGRRQVCAGSRRAPRAAHSPWAVSAATRPTSITRKTRRCTACWPAGACGCESWAAPAWRRRWRVSKVSNCCPQAPKARPILPLARCFFLPHRRVDGSLWPRGGGGHGCGFARGGACPRGLCRSDGRRGFGPAHPVAGRGLRRGDAAGGRPGAYAEAWARRGGSRRWPCTARRLRSERWLFTLGLQRLLDKAA